MKKLSTILTTVVALLLTTSLLTACDEDAQIAMTLEGTWQGRMYVYTTYGGRDYYATSTQITFEGDPFRWSRGTGYWVDYYSGAPWDYVANHIEWRVVNRDIEIYFREEDTSLLIADYSLNNNYFTGYIADGDNDVEFRLQHIDSPDYSGYHWGYSYWSRQTRSAATATDGSSSTEKPVRHVGIKP